MRNKTIILLAFLLIIGVVSTKGAKKLSVINNIKYCESQAQRTLAVIPSYNVYPTSIDKDGVNWHFATSSAWTAGFWPGVLWYLYENSKDDMWKKAADNYTKSICPVTKRKVTNHDIGFVTMCSLGNGYRLTGNKEYKDGLLQAADSLALLFNSKVGTILSWPHMVQKENWPHNTIIDNMMNLELLYWAARNGGSHHLYDIATKHADVTMMHHFRPDYSCYHVAVYDTITGNFIKGVTHQGLNDNSMWARGQAWAIYGYTMVYRETKEPRFLDFAQKVANVYLERLPKKMIPCWDFDASKISTDEPKDASAAAITASALLELSTYIKDSKFSHYYYEKAKKMLEKLSSTEYQAGSHKSAFLLHSVGHKPHGGEVDASIIYADYYYLEALTRLRKIQNGLSLLENL